MPAKLYHQSGAATRAVGQKPDAARTIATEVCAFGAALVSVLGCVCACSAKVQQRPPELGNCYAGDASCSPLLGVGGSGSGPPQDAASGDATAPSQDAASGVDVAALPQEARADALDESADDGGPCGTAHNGVHTQNPMCLPCIVQQCCQADSICSKDLACPSLVSSAFPGSGMPMCQSQTLPASCTNFLDFAMCIASCPSCPSLTLRDD
jgi:hypothetical protein